MPKNEGMRTEIISSFMYLPIFTTLCFFIKETESQKGTVYTQATGINDITTYKYTFSIFIRYENIE